MRVRPLLFAALDCKKYDNQHAPKHAPRDTEDFRFVSGLRRSRRRLYRIAFALSLLYLLAASQAHAVINFYSAQARPGQPIPSVCTDAGHVLQRELTRFPHPPQWTYIVVCDESSWDRVMALDGLDEIGKSVFGTTSLKYATTFFRGPSLTGKGDTRLSPDEIVAHELGHIYLNTLDEYKVTALADRWVKEHRVEVMAEIGGAR